MTKLKPEPIIHRIVKIYDNPGSRSFNTKGDHNQESHMGIDINVHEDEVLGKATLRVPYLGWAKIWFVDFVAWLTKIVN